MGKSLIEIAKAVIQTEAESVLALKDRINSKFEEVCNTLKECSGKVVLIGMGKSGHIAKKISSTFKNYFNVEFLDIKICFKILSKIKKGKFIIDKNSCSYFFENIISKNNKILSFQDPIYFFKSIKGRQEIENIKKDKKGNKDPLQHVL